MKGGATACKYIHNMTYHLSSAQYSSNNSDMTDCPKANKLKSCGTPAKAEAEAARALHSLSQELQPASPPLLHILPPYFFLSSWCLSFFKSVPSSHYCQRWCWDPGLECWFKPFCAHCCVSERSEVNVVTPGKLLQEDYRLPKKTETFLWIYFL